MMDQKPKILAIDDAPVNLFTLGSALAPDFDLQIATSGSMALALATESPPDLILLDVMMPDMDGYETCRRIKAEPKLRDIPVIFITALHDSGAEVKGLSLGAADYITKPINVEIARQRIRNLLDRERLRKKVEAQHVLLGEALTRKLDEAQNQLLQSEKMAAIGQLAAGVAHEINNPIGFVNSNLSTLEKYVRELMEIVSASDAMLNKEDRVAAQTCLAELLGAKDFAYLKEDIFPLLAESRDGLERVRRIVQDLKDFSHVGSTDWQWTNLNKGLDTTLNIVWNELKYHCKVHKEYGDLPDVYCLPSQINQVFLNLLVNASQAIEDSGDIRLRTGREGDTVWVEVIDNGKGIVPENLSRLFEPFFTTKPVGKGTGLGLALAYGIVQRHRGRIEVDSVAGRGSTFRVLLPIKPIQPEADTAETMKMKDDDHT